MLCEALYAVAACALHLEDLEEAGAPSIETEPVRVEMIRLVEVAIPDVDLKMLLYLVGDEPRCREAVRAAIEAKVLWEDIRKEAS